jgi:predicted peptidase
MMKFEKLGFLMFLLSAILLASCASQVAEPEENTSIAENEELASITPTLFSELSADNLMPGQNPYSYIATTGEEVPYLLYLPEDYQQHDSWPMIVFLHGAGSYGGNLDLLIGQGGLPAFVEDDPDFAFIVLSPQLPSGRWGKYIGIVDELILHLSSILTVDTNRLYLTGLSLGALGTWQYALEYPDRFAAIAPVAGSPSFSGSTVPENICTLSNLSIWVFHGDADDISSELNQATVSELENCGADIKFTLYPDVDHSGTWPIAYADPALYEWFLEKSK